MCTGRPDGAPDACAAYMPKSVLVTGGAGFIASNVVCYLTNKYPSTTWVVYDKLSYCANIRNLEEVWNRDNFEFVKGDIIDQEHVSSVLKIHKIDTIMHFAAESHVDNSFLSPERFTLNNTTGTQRLLEATRKAGNQIRRFIAVSTDEVYGCCNNADAKVETDNLSPTNPYAASKAAAEMIVTSYYYSFKLPIIITRGNNVYGPKQLPEKLIPKFITQLRQGNKVTIHGDGGSKRSWLYIDDVVRAFETILLHGEIGQTYNMGTSNEYTVMEVTRELLKARGFETTETQDENITFVADRVFNDGSYTINSNKLKSLGWQEEVNFAEGLTKTVEWYDAHTNHWDPKVVAEVTNPHPTTGKLAALETELQVENGLQPNLSVKMRNGTKPTWLLFGGGGWIGPMVRDCATAQGIHVISATSRLENRSGIRTEIELHNPTRVVSCAGVTGRPNVDWCEDNKETVVRSNVIGTLNLLDLCHQMKIHVTNLATGCIFVYDKDHPEPQFNGKWSAVPQFSDSDDANFTGSWYSRTKGYVDSILQRSYPAALTLRLRMPISDDLAPRNFVTKIVKYEKVVNIPNSMSVLHDLLPLMVGMVEESVSGIFNFTNPGVVSHNQVLDQYTKFMDPGFTYQNFSLEEHDKILKAKRSNNWLSTLKLEKVAARLNIPLPHINKALEGVFQRMAAQT